MPSRRIGPGDRLVATMALSALVHGILILGIGFTLADPAPVLPTLDVILTQTRTPEAPEHADFLAEANQQGGGESDIARRPGEPQLANVPKPDPGIAPQPMQAENPPPQPDATQRLLTTTNSTQNVAAPQEAQPVSTLPLPTGAELTERNLEMARLAAEIQQTQQVEAKRPKKKYFFSASTQEYEYAAYMRTYVARLQRIGTLNFPDEARRRNLSGSVVLTVEIHRDGSLASVTTVQSSGIPVLDQAAQQTVRMAAPFGELPRTKDNPDLLNITRTFHYDTGKASVE